MSKVCAEEVYNFFYRQPKQNGWECLSYPVHILFCLNIDDKSRTLESLQLCDIFLNKCLKFEKLESEK